MDCNQQGQKMFPEFHMMTADVLTYKVNYQNIYMAVTVPNFFNTDDKACAIYTCIITENKLSGIVGFAFAWNTLLISKIDQLDLFKI